MDTPSGKVDTDRRRLFLKIGAAVAAVALLVSGLAWWMAPRIAESLFYDQIEELERRTGLSVDIGSFETVGREGFAIEEIEIGLADSAKTLGTIDSIDVSMNLTRALRGGPTITGLQLEGLRFSIHRYEDGSTDLDRIMESIRARAGEEESPEDAPDLDLEERLDAMGQRLLRRFGDAYPDVLVIDAVIEFTAHEEAPRWPAKGVSTDQFSIEGGQSAASFATVIAIDADDTSELELPSSLDLTGTLRKPITTTTLRIDFSPSIGLVDLEYLPFSSLSLSAFEIADGHTVIIEDLEVDSHLEQEAKRLASAERIRVRLTEWTTRPSASTVTEVEVDSPRLFLEFDDVGTSSLGQLYHVIYQPSARSVTDRARVLTAAIEQAMQDVEGEVVDDTDSLPGQSDRPPGLLSRLGEFPIQQWLVQYLPRQTTFRDLRLVVDDQREHENLTRPAPHFEITGEILDLQHNPLRGVLEGAFKFQIVAGDDTGRTDVEFHIPYRKGEWDVSVDVDDLQLAHFSQLFGARVAEYLHGGQVAATLEIKNDGTGQASITHFDGLVAVQQFRVDLPGIAEDPIEVPQASLVLEGHFDPELPVPPPDLVFRGYSVPDDDDPDEDEPAENDEPFPFSPPEKGALIVDRAVATLGEVESEFSIAVHGIDGLERPNRFTIEIDLETTPLQAIANSVPAALRGPMDGIELQGDLTWDFKLEIPLYEASTMAWDANVDLSPDVAVLYLPEQVDVFKLTEEFEHTITDEWTAPLNYRPRDFFYERTVTIPEMRPTPATWLMENAALDLARIDARRRRRGWPAPPYAGQAPGLTQDLINSPEYWLSEHALRQSVTDPPWHREEESSLRESASMWDDFAAAFEDEGQPTADPDQEGLLVYEAPEPIAYHQNEVHIDPDRNGPYVYVPLHHISPYMPRAILTTEDTSFFTHDGFNFLAIRHAVEANLEAGRYVRGASTISMQLVKNVFLDRSRVLSRKLQEVALVWLMESVADIPKARILEVYLNVIEFGPGIFGIHEASVHYFGKRPDELTIGECAWLVSIVPNPKRYHRYYDRGEITAVWFRRMSRYIRAMYNRDRISEVEMEAASRQPPSFYIPEEGEPLLRRAAGHELEPIEPDEAVTADGDDETDEETPRGVPFFD